MSLDPIPQENSKTQCMSLPTFAFFRAHEITRYIAVSFSEPWSECGFFILLISSRSLPNNWMTLFKENRKIYPKDEFYILKLAKDIYLSGDSASLFSPDLVWSFFRQLSKNLSKRFQNVNFPNLFWYVQNDT